MRNSTTQILNVSKKLSLFFACCLFTFGSIAQMKTVSGKVIGADKQPLIGANIMVKGTTIGTSTDINGAFKINAPSSASTLTISSVGMRTKEVAISNDGNVEVVMEEETNQLNDVIVTATAQPVRKLETVTAVEAISLKQIERSTSVNIADAIKFVPGVFVHNGPGRTRNSIWLRGFPDNTNNGLVYTSLLADGLRTFASPELVPDAAFRLDLNVDRIEVVRGSAATLYGRGAVAGAINVIARTGGEQIGGATRLTFSNNDMYQLDFNVNGPLNDAKTLRFNLGGFYLTDKGYRNNPFPDYGGQIRYNLDYLIPNNGGNIRLYGGYINLNVQNQIDIPYRITDLNKPAFGWNVNDVTYTKNFFSGRQVPVSWASGQSEIIDFDKTASRGNFSQGSNYGLNLDINLGNGWKWVNKARYQDMIIGTIFDFPLAQYFNDNQNRAFFLGGLPGDGGSHAIDFINETRLQKQLIAGETTHNLTAGFYYSTVTVNAASAGLLYNVKSENKDGVEFRGFGGAPGLFLTSIFRNGKYIENVTSFFFGDELKIKDKLTISGGVRYDKIDLDLTENRYSYQKDAKRIVSHDGTSFSLGFNYLLDQNSAIYGNYTNAFRAPDYSAYTTVQYAYRNPADPEGTAILWNPATAPANAVRVDRFGRTLYVNPYVDKNETINSYEVGYRTSWKDFSFDGGIFFNTIYDRLVSTFIGGTAVQVPGGDNQIFGTELSLTWTPSSAKGWYFRGSTTLQKTKYLKLEQGVLVSSRNGTALAKPEQVILNLAGNRVASVPSFVFNFNAGYENDRFGFNLNNNLITGRPVDQANTIDYPALNMMDANVFYKIPLEGKQSLKLRASCYNLLYETNASSIVSAQTDDTFYQGSINNNAGNFSYVRGVPVLPRRVMFSLEFTF